jgi:hypothetical protein
MRTLVLIFLGLVLGGALAASPAQATEIEVSGAMGVDVASAYVFRGAAVNKNWNLQPYVEAATHGVTVGGWWNWNMDIEEFDEIDFYASWELPLSKEQPIGLSLGYTNFDFPGSGLGDSDKEVQLGFTLDSILQPTALVGIGLDGPYLDKGVHLALGASHDWVVGEKVAVNGGATLGLELGDNVPKSGVSFLQLTLGASYDIIGVSLNYIVETDAEVLPVEENFYVAFSLGI